GSCWRRQRLRMAMATAFLAASWPTMYRSSSCTIWRGVNSATVHLQIADCRLQIADLNSNLQSAVCNLQSQFFHFNVPIRVNAQVAGDFHAGTDDLGGAQLGVDQQGAG